MTLTCDTDFRDFVAALIMARLVSEEASTFSNPGNAEKYLDRLARFSFRAAEALVSERQIKQQLASPN